ncbi:erythromycin esterase family protein [Pseudonocardia sp. HH130630-07]|uniref:erythromycin esterase family protein n=1 Tax=Pseudonocardia sp. HH130630-07 TaxID=1690815 RepID=UPI00081534DB|nr:erythromycin esterase family protein [Pseudonocardia sp. HH130630-07]ANY08604.1 hypothetical protein AFB00_22685 [Pseudonocardia sp. HH130630-07]
MTVDEILPLLDDRTRLLGLTEPLHGQEHLPLLRNTLLRALVERAGYRSVAVESCCLRGLDLDARLARGVPPDAAQVAAGFSHGFGDTASGRELASWIAEHNRGAAAGDRVRFAGVDAPMEMAGMDSPRAALERLHGFLVSRGAPDLPSWDRIDALLGAEDAWTAPAAMWDPAHSIGGGDAVAELAVLAGDLAWRHATTAPGGDGPADDDAWWDAGTAARSATGLLACHRLVATDGPDRWMLLSNQRDAMIAANLAALVERERGRGPTLVFAHQQHLRRGTASWGETRWNGAGSLLGPRLGPELSVVATVLGSAPLRRIGPPEQGTIEQALIGARPGGGVLTAARAREIAAGAGVRDAGSREVGYFPADADLLAEVDLVLVVPELTS